MNLIDRFLTHAEARPDAAAIITPAGETVSYADISRRSAARAAAWAREGIGVGDVVLVARGVSPALYETLLALFRLGAVAMFPEPAAGLNGVKAAIGAAKPKAMAAGWLGRALRVVTPELGRLKLLSEEAPPLAHGDGMTAVIPESAPALITFTSGSTGRPKGIVRSTGFLMLQHALLEELRRTAPDDVDLISLPVFILSNLAEGAASVIPKGRLTRPASLDGASLRAQVAAHRVNRVAAPPAVCARLSEDAQPMALVSAMFTGGGPVFPNLLRAMRKAAPNAAVHAVYGSTEAEPIAHIAYDEISEADWRTMAEGGGLLAGRPIPEIEVSLRDHEVHVAGAHVNRGYLDPAGDRGTKVREGEKLWHRTGDAARIDDQGRLWLLGRREAASGGLFPFAVETAAMSWPGVKHAGFLAERGRARLAVEGEFDAADIASRARKLGEIETVRVAKLPLDKRHNSKVDYARLRKMLA